MPDATETVITLRYRDEKKKPKQIVRSDLTSAQEWKLTEGQFQARVVHVKGTSVNPDYDRSRAELPETVDVKLSDGALVEVDKTGGDGKQRIFIKTGGSFMAPMPEKSEYANIDVIRRIVKPQTA